MPSKPPVTIEPSGCISPTLAIGPIPTVAACGSPLLIAVRASPPLFERSSLNPSSRRKEKQVRDWDSGSVKELCKNTKEQSASIAASGRVAAGRYFQCSSPLVATTPKFAGPGWPHKCTEGHEQVNRWNNNSVQFAAAPCLATHSALSA